MFRFRKRVGVEIKTFKTGGRYQHNITYIGEGYISDEALQELKESAERWYDEMPSDSEGLVLRASYVPPKER